MPPKPIIAAKLPIRLPTWRPTPSCSASSSANERRNRPGANRSDPLDKSDKSLTWDLSAETLTDAEHAELIRRVNEVELWNARRLEAVAELAKLRGVRFPDLVKQLGLGAPANA